MKWKHRKTDEIVTECPKDIHHLYWVESKDEEDAKAKQEEDALLIKSIERDRKFLQQSLKYQQTKVAFMNQHGAPDNCPDLLAKKEELVKQKELDIKQCNDKIFAIKHAEANSKQVWKNNQTGKTTKNCPKKIK